MIILVLILFLQASNIQVFATETQTYYAKILFEQVYLYRTPVEDNSYSNIFFELPKTYFVELIDVENNFYKAKYLNFTGYVKKDSVQAVANTPKNPFLNNVTFRVYAELSEKLWPTPSTLNSAPITEIPPLTKNIQYIGKLNGECLIDGRTSVWFFCKYNTANNEHYGYVYSDFCDEITPILNNTEEIAYINNPTFKPTPIQINAIPKDSNAVGIIIGIMSIPALIFVFMLLKGTRFLSAEKIKKKEVIDY